MDYGSISSLASFTGSFTGPGSIGYGKGYGSLIERGAAGFQSLPGTGLG